MTEPPSQGDPRVLHDAQIYTALGVFLVFFGVVVLMSILFTDTGIGKLTNLGSGAIIASVGAAMVYRGHRLKRPR